MGATLANPSLNRISRGRGKTAFERNLLPGFARWILDELERREPDYLIPVETKGARVLEAVLRFAREELGEPVAVPVVYASALAYIDPKKLAASRVMIIDDAVCTGGSLQRHRSRIERYGPTVIEALACVGDATEAHPGADCYRSVDARSYREHTWQLAELVVARGLPPEVDHHLFELRLAGRLESSWWALKALLRDHGTLTVDAPDIQGDTLQPITLHFPDFPGVRKPGSEAPHKLRLFPDPLNDCVYVVPVSFPPFGLPVPPDAGDRPPESWRSSPEAAHEILRNTAGAGPLGEVLVGAAEVLDPETIFAAVSSVVEFELVRGLKALLARALPGASLRFQADQYLRFYGAETGVAVADVVGIGLADVPAAAEPQGPDPAAPDAFVGETPFLDHEIAQATRRIAEQLRRMQEEARKREGAFPPRRVGLAMQALDDLVGDPLLASRCVDYGLAMTTLVPFVNLEIVEGALRLERRYRVSEPREDERRPYGDMSEVREALSAEMLASICFCVGERSESYRGKSLSPQLLSSLVGILKGLVCEEHSIELRALPAPGWEAIVLCTDDRPLTLDDHHGDMLTIDDVGVRASAGFCIEWTGNKLRLDERNSTEDIEEHVALLIEFLDGMPTEAHGDLLRAWAMCADRRVGLTHVRSSLDAALIVGARALKQVKSKELHSTANMNWERHTAAAQEKLRVLRQDWAAPVRERWKERPSKRQKRVIDSLGAPDPALDVYRTPECLTALIEALGPLVEQVNAASARLWEDEATPSDAAIPSVIFQAAANIRAVLCTFDKDFEPQIPPENLRDGLVGAAEELLDVIELVRAFVAATAGLYRGFWDGHRRPLGENKRTVTVLSVDIAGSSVHGSNHTAPDHRKWIGGGLNVAAQWGRAFTGREGKPREGDEVWIEYPPGDAAVICGAAILQHAAALRSTGIEDISWRFHVGAHAGELEEDDGNNVVAHAMNKVTKLAKECDGEAKEDSVHLTPEAWKTCSAELEDGGFSTREDRIALAGESLRPWAIDSAQLMASFGERIAELSTDLIALAGTGENPLELGGGEVAEDEVGHAAD
jgi:hypothetical protein